MPSPRRDGRDSMRVRLMPRSESSRRAAISVPGRSCATVKAIDVLSSPVGSRVLPCQDEEARLVVRRRPGCRRAGSTPPCSSAARARADAGGARRLHGASSTAAAVESAASRRALRQRALEEAAALAPAPADVT